MYAIITSYLPNMDIEFSIRTTSNSGSNLLKENKYKYGNSYILHLQQSCSMALTYVTYIRLESNFLFLPNMKIEFRIRTIYIFVFVSNKETKNKHGNIQFQQIHDIFSSWHGKSDRVHHFEWSTHYDASSINRISILGRGTLGSIQVISIIIHVLYF